jgi:hypothetical protein
LSKITQPVSGRARAVSLTATQEFCLACPLDPPPPLPNGPFPHHQALGGGGAATLPTWNVAKFILQGPQAENQQGDKAGLEGG